MKIGFGYDVHKLVKGKPLILGGVDIPSKKGLTGYSDADVLSHAIIDSLIGALGIGDIGKHFPAGDARFKGISSLKLLRSVAGMLKSEGYEVVNIDSTVVIQEPRLAPFVEGIRSNIADALGISPAIVNVKAKTEEGLGFTGSGSGVSSYAVCLITKK